jgi:hypothetical protein
MQLTCGSRLSLTVHVCSLSVGTLSLTGIATKEVGRTIESMGTACTPPHQQVSSKLESGMKIRCSDCICTLAQFQCAAVLGAATTWYAFLFARNKAAIKALAFSKNPLAKICDGKQGYIVPSYSKARYVQ